MSYSLGIAVRDRSVLVVTDDFKYENVVLFKPINGLKIEGEAVKLVCVYLGEKEKRALVHEIMTNAERVDYNKDDILGMMREHGVELRVITDKSVHVFQNIRGVETHGTVDSNVTTFWIGSGEHRKLFFPYCGAEGKPFRQAYRDEELCRVFEFVTVVDL